MILLNFFLNAISHAVSGYGAAGLRSGTTDPTSVHLIYFALAPFIGGAYSIDAGGFFGAAWGEMRTRLTTAMTTISTIARIVYWGLVAPILWIFAYVRLTETEVRNGV